MRIKLDRIPSTIRAVCVLHNLAKQWKDPVENLPPRPQEQLNFSTLNMGTLVIPSHKTSLMLQKTVYAIRLHEQARRPQVKNYLWDNRV